MDNIRVEITDLTEEGNGVARHGGKVVFVKDALPGELVDIRLTDVKKKYDLGRVVRYHRKDASRQVPFCRHYGVCGGCSLQHLSYERGLEFKASWVRSAFVKIAGIEIPLPEIVAMKNRFNYRDKVVFHGFFKDEAYRLGFFKKGSKDLVEISECVLLPDVFLEVKAELESLCALYNCFPKDVVMKTDGEVVLVRVDGPCLDNIGLVAEELKARMPVVRFFIYKGADDPEALLEMKLGDKIFFVSAYSFFQVNLEGALVLFDKIRFLLPEGVGDLVLFDLFCGVGSVGVILGDRFREVRGFEVVEDAVRLAGLNAKMNGVVNCSFSVGRVEDVVSASFFDDAGVVVLDPPRSGVDPGVVDALVGSGVEHIVYVGCSLGKMVRDISRFMAGGFVVVSVFCVDMFPWTGHVETLVLMSRVDKQNN